MHTARIPLKQIQVKSPLYLIRWEPVGSLDFLLPAMHLHKLEMLKQDEGAANFLLRTLIGRYRNRIMKAAIAGRKPADPPVLRTRYQKAGLKLRRISVRVEAEVWVELKILSLAARCSMSLILVLMVQWEYARRFKFTLRGWALNVEGYVGTPTTSRVTMSFHEKSRIYTLRARFSKSAPLSLPDWYRPSS